MTNLSNRPALKRFYKDDYERADFDNTDMLREMHALYTHWIEQNWLASDFTVAIENAAGLAYSRYGVADHPVFTGQRPQLAETALASGEKEPYPGPALRFYDDSNAINGIIDLYAFDSGLWPLFVCWVMDGWHARDFLEATKDCASKIVYDHHVCCARRERGGGKTGEEFLAEPYSA